MTTAPPRLSSCAAFLTLVIAVLGTLLPTPADAAAARSTLERRAEDVIVGLHDVARGDPGRFGYGGAARQAPLTGWTDLRETAREWSDGMGQRRQLSHNGSMSSQVCCARAAGENVGSRSLHTADAATVTAAARALFQAWMDSQGHRANVMDGRYDDIGVGARIAPNGSSYMLYVTVNFRDRDPSAQPPGVVYHRPARAIGDTCDGSDAAGYDDVPARNAHRATIACIRAYGITEGDGRGGFGPADRLSRAQLATFLTRTLATGGVAIPSEVGDHFDDDDGSPHERSLNVLAELGVLDRSDRRVGPGVQVSREEMSLWTTRALVHGGGIDADRAVGDHFSDDDDSGAQNAINRLADAGVVTGSGDGTFGPTRLLRRDQMATFLARSLDLLLDT